MQTSGYYLNAIGCKADGPCMSTEPIDCGNCKNAITSWDGMPRMVAQEKKLCRNCKWWQHTPYRFGDCLRVDAPSSTASAHGDLHTTEAFGCVQWEERE